MAIVDVDALFAALAELDARFEDRPQQRAMAEAVADALRSEKGLVVEAGTGVGKSLGYLLPAALWAVSNERRVLVSTYTRALQEQILEKDLPVVARILRRVGAGLTYAMLQGADNYLCAQRLARLSSQPELLPDAAGKIDELVGYARDAKTGHRSSIPFHVPQQLWSRVARDPDVCLGANGPYWSRCLFRKDRELADRSHIVVVNHALLLSGARLPSYDALIVDEAHNLEEAAVSHFGLVVSQGRFARLLDDLRAHAPRVPALEEPVERVAGEARAFFESLAKSHNAGTEPGGRLLSAKEAPAAPETLAALELAVASAAGGEKDADRETELRLLHGKTSQLRSDLAWILGEAAEDTARWVEWSSQGAVELRAAPLEVGSRLQDGLFSRGVPAILTSATLSSGRGLAQFSRSVGYEGARELALDSPYDYPSQAGLLLCDDLPEPSEDKKYVAALAERCEEIIARVPGGLFILFSSWRSLRATHEKLRKKIEGRPLWIQGSQGSEALIEDFSRAGNAVLLGVDTFWQGVDVQGAALSCVVLVKLPFPNYGSPVEEARRKWYESMGRDYFGDHSLPRAVQKFRQGFGRLIRSSTDKGAVVVLDSRVVKRGYGRAFIEALPRCKRLSSLDDLAGFFSAEAPKP